MHTIYLEKQAKTYTKTQEILQKFPGVRVIEIEKYSEIFNRKNQDFLAQKESQALILAVKQGEFVQKNPDYCVSDAPHNYYFSTTLNCPFACEYCFLQGMYRSAHILLFVNTEDFQTAIAQKIALHSGERVNFFSSYDNDGLALDGITGFTSDFIPWFAQFSNATLEVRSKSANIAPLKKLSPTENALIAFTLSPAEIQEQYEKKTASLSERIQALTNLQKIGWKVAIRIEPIILLPNWKDIYTAFFSTIKEKIDFSKVKNIYFGMFKLPPDFLKNMQKIYPRSKLFHSYFEQGKDGELSYSFDIKIKTENFMYKKCLELINSSQIYSANKNMILE